MTTDAELDEKLARLAGRVQARSAETRALLADAGCLELAEAARETFGALRISGRLVGKPDPEWTRWPSHTAADMAPAAWRAPGRREAQARCLADALTAAAVQP